VSIKNPNSGEGSSHYRFIFIDRFIDRFVCTKPRLFNVGYPPYLIIVTSYVCAIVRDYIIGVFNTSFSTLIGSLWWALIQIASFIVGIAFVGSAIAPQLYYKESGIRNIEFHLQSLLTRIVRDHEAGFRVSAKLTLYALLVVNAMIVAWLWYKPVDISFSIAFGKAIAGEPSGYIALALDAMSTLLLILFWNIFAVVFAYIIGIPFQAFSRISQAIKLESEGVDALALDDVLKDIVSNDKPVLRFLRFRKQLSHVSESMLTVVKRVALLVILIMAGAFF